METMGLNTEEEGSTMAFLRRGYKVMGARHMYHCDALQHHREGPPSASSPCCSFLSLAPSASLRRVGQRFPCLHNSPGSRSPSSLSPAASPALVPI